MPETFTKKEIDAKEARMLLDHPLLKKAFHEVKEKYVFELEECDATDRRAHTALTLGLQVLKAVKYSLENVINDNMLDNSQPEGYIDE